MVLYLLPKIPESYIINCTIEFKENDGMDCMFYEENNVIFPRLNGYAIIPVEKYNELIKNSP